MKQILILLGKARSGKDTVADFLVKEFSFKKFVFSSVLEEELKKKRKLITKQNMSLLGDELRKEFGMQIIAEKLLEKVSDEQKIVFVGARSPEEIELIKQKFPEAKTFLVEASQEKRFKRRNGLDANTLKAFFERDEIDSEKKGMKKAFGLADYKLENNSSLSDLLNKTKALMYNIFKD